MVTVADSPSEVTQAEIGMVDGAGTTDVPVSGMETVYVGSQVCPGCGTLMTPLEVMFGAGLCPKCQNAAHNDHIQRRMV